MADREDGPLVIEAGTAAHREAVAALWERCGLTTSYNDPLLDFDRARGKPGSEVLVAVADGHVVASVMVGHDGHRGWVYYVAVDPAWRGRDVGTRMMHAAEEWLRARGVPKVQLLIRETNRQVQEFYEHLAYERSSVIVMQKWLIPPE